MTRSEGFCVRPGMESRFCWWLAAPSGSDSVNLEISANRKTFSMWKIVTLVEIKWRKC